MSTSIFTRASAMAERSKFAAIARRRFTSYPRLAGLVVSTAESYGWDPNATFVVNSNSATRIAYLRVNKRGDVETSQYVYPANPADPIWAAVMLELKRMAITEALAPEDAR